MTLTTTTAGSFNTKMVGGDIEVHGIDIPAAVKKEFSGLPLQTNDVIGSKFTLPRYKARIDGVLSDKKLTTSKPYSVRYKFNAEAQTVAMYSDIGSPIPADNLYANFTASYVDWNVPTTSSYRFDTFIDVDVSNMRTFSGDVYRMKVYGASDMIFLLIVMQPISQSLDQKVEQAFLYPGNKEKNTTNGYILNITIIIKNVMASAAKLKKELYFSMID